MNPSRVRPHTLRVSEMDDSGYLFSGNLKNADLYIAVKQLHLTIWANYERQIGH